MIEVIWQFEVRAHRVAEFEQHYGPRGTWANFFRASPDYLGTSLMRGQMQHLRYLTIDRWVDLSSYEAFKAANAAHYEQLDSEMEQLTTNEMLLGIFEIDEAVRD